MKRVLLTFITFLYWQSIAFAMQLPSSEGENTLFSHKHIKVSELNANLFSAIYDFFKEAGSVIFEGFVSLKDFIEIGEWFVFSLQNAKMREVLSTFGLHFGIAFLFALIVSKSFQRWFKPKTRTLIDSKSLPSPTKQIRLMFAILLSITPPVVFGFIFYTLFRIFNLNDGLNLEIVRIFSSGTVTIWVLLNVAHLFLKPATLEHKHIPLSQEVLTVTYIWLRRMGAVALFGFFSLEAAHIIHLPPSGIRLLLQSSGFVIAILAILMMLDLHVEVRNWIQNQRNHPKLTPLRKALLPYLEYSYLPAIVFIVISYVSWATHEFDHFQRVIWNSLVTLALFPLLRVGAYWLRKLRILCLHKKVQNISQPLAKGLLTYGDQIDFVTISLLNLGAFLFVLSLWGLDPTYFIFSEGGRFIAEKALSIFVIIFLALLITRTGNDLITRYLNKEKSTSNEKQKQKQARYKTISSVSRNVLRIAVWTPAILLIIMELDIDIVPIIATVGVLSVGLSFGVQSLVKDLVTGFFMLLEDAFAVGDLVTINGQMGIIESLTVRIVRLRASDGSIYTFPYGNIASLSNQNRDYSAVVLLFTVGIEADIEHVFTILENVTTDLQKDKIIRNLMKGPIEISGVNQLSDHSLEIRAILKTKPGQHYKVKWAFNRLLKQYLESDKVPSALPRMINYNYAVEK